MKKKIIFFLVIMLVLIVIIYYTLPWVAMIMHKNTGAYIIPEQTYGEFPFKLVYQMNDKNKVIEDKIICSFEGYEHIGIADEKRTWKMRFESGKERIVLCDFHNVIEKDSWGYRILEIYFYPGNAEYYMDDALEHNKIKAEISKTISYVYCKDDGTIGFSAFSADEAWEKYNIRLISWECSPPIENTFH